MAHLDKEELLDFIRHECKRHDDDGLCESHLDSPKRRAKFGGLPLNFRGPTERERDPFDDDWRIPMYEEPFHTGRTVSDQLAKWVVEKVTKKMPIVVEQKKAEDLFVEQSCEWPVDRPSTSKKSVVDEYLELNATSQNSELNAFSKFGACGTESSKSIKIIFPQSDENDEMKVVEIRVINSARVREVIGYCIFKYYADYGRILSGEIDDYQLYMGEDDGEIEVGLPALEGWKLIGQFGFDYLGLVKCKRPNRLRMARLSVTVWFIDRDFYNVEVDSAERTLKWLIDTVLERREEKKKNEKLPDGFVPVKEYYIESVKNMGVRLNEDLTVEASGHSSFVMVRKNSSRGDFHPDGARMGRQVSALQLLSSPASPSPMTTRNPLEFFAEQSDNFNQYELADTLSTFDVWRLHNFKPKWKATFTLRGDCFVIERKTHNKSILPQGYQKTTTVPWEYVGGARLVQKSLKREVFWNLTISWARVLEDDVIKTRIGDEDWSLKDVLNFYPIDEPWKQVSVESTDKELMERLLAQLNRVLQARDTAIQKAFLHSQNGVKSPFSGAEIALMDSTEGPIATPVDRGKPKFSKMTNILQSIRKSSSAMLS